jgi:uncharacterized membrane protein
MIRTIGWPLFVVFVGVACAVTIIANVESPLRAAFGFVFLLVCPGISWIRLLNVRDLAVELTLSVALSITLGVIVAQIMVYFRVWSLQWGLLALICLSMVGVNLQVVQVYRRSSKAVVTGLGEDVR